MTSSDGSRRTQYTPSSDAVTSTAGDAPWLDREPTPHDRPEVVKLARLLDRAAEQVDAANNSSTYSDLDRQQLRELVSWRTFTLLIYNLVDLRSEGLRQEHHTLGYPLELVIPLFRSIRRSEESGEADATDQERSAQP